MKTTTKNRKRNDMVDYLKLVVSFTIVNDEPSLTIVNDDFLFDDR